MTNPLMILTDDNSFFAVATKFGDGAGGYYKQTYDLTYCGIPTGCQYVVEGRRGASETCDFRDSKGVKHSTLKGAAVASGHIWQREGKQ